MGGQGSFYLKWWLHSITITNWVWSWIINKLSCIGYMDLLIHTPLIRSRLLSQEIRLTQGLQFMLIDPDSPTNWFALCVCSSSFTRNIKPFPYVIPINWHWSPIGLTWHVIKEANFPHPEGGVGEVVNSRSRNKNWNMEIVGCLVGNLQEGILCVYNKWLGEIHTSLCFICGW